MSSSPTFPMPQLLCAWDQSREQARDLESFHPHWRLVAITEGVYRSTNNTHEHLIPGQLFLLQPNQSAMWHPTSGAREIGLVFQLTQTANEIRKPLEDGVIPLELGQRQLPRLTTIASMWWLGGGHMLRAHALLALLLADLIEHSEPQAQPDQPPVLQETTDERVLTAERLARNRLNSWTVADMARAVGMERSAFTRLYQDCRGQSPGAWLDAARLSLAQSLLASNNKDIPTIAKWTGHRRVPSFGRWFKSRTGLTPGGYRRAAQGN